MPSNILGVNLGNNQWHIFVHAESTGIVDHNGTGIYNSLTHFLRNARTSAEQCNVYALEGFGSHLLNGEFTRRNLTAALKGASYPQNALRQVHEFQFAGNRDRKNLEEFVADSARGASYSNNRICGDFLVQVIEAPLHRVLEEP